MCSTLNAVNTIAAKAAVTHVTRVTHVKFGQYDKPHFADTGGRVIVHTPYKRIFYALFRTRTNLS